MTTTQLVAQAIIHLLNDEHGVNETGYRALEVLADTLPEHEGIQVSGIFEYTDCGESTVPDEENELRFWLEDEDAAFLADKFDITVEGLLLP